MQKKNVTFQNIQCLYQKDNLQPCGAPGPVTPTVAEAVVVHPIVISNSYCVGACSQTNCTCLAIAPCIRVY